MEARYDPQRVQDLNRRTSEAINALSRLSSGDPSATDALRTVRLTQRNLEDHWMVALRDISGSNAMVSWQASQLTALRSRLSSPHADNLPDHLSAANPAISISDLRRAELLGAIDFLERKALGGGDGSDTPTASDLARQQQLDALARQVALWVRNDPSFAAELVELSATNMTVAELLGHASFPSSFASDVVRRMAVPNGPETNVDPDLYAASLSIALSSLVADPGACLDLLMSRDLTVLYTLGNWERLDQKVVTEFMVAGLHEAVELDPRRLADSYRALQNLTVLANDPLDHHISPGVALGFAISMDTYLDTISLSGDYSTDDSQFTVSDRFRGIDVPLGTYLDVKGLFGVMMRHEEARAVLGGVTADWATATLRETKSEDLFTTHLTNASNFTQLLIASSYSEQEQMVTEAADEEADKRKVGDFLGFAVDGVLQIKKVPATVRKGIGFALAAATNWISKTNPNVMPGAPWGREIHQQMVVTAIEIGVEQSDFFDTSGGNESPLTPAQRRAVTADLEKIELTLDPGEREAAINDMTSHIEAHVPALTPALNAVQTNGEASKLTGE